MDINQSIQQYGLGAIVTLLAGVVGFLYREIKARDAKYDAIQEKRLQDAINARDKIVEPLSQQIEMSKKIYDLLSVFNKRGE